MFFYIVTMAELMDKAMNIMMVLFLVGIIGPIVFSYLAGAGDFYIVIGGINQTFGTWVGVGSPVYTVYTILLPVLGIIGIAFLIYRGTKSKGE